VAARSKLWVYGLSLAGMVGSNSAGGMSVCLSCENCLLSRRGLWDGLNTRPEESYRVWCGWVWSWSLNNEEALTHWGLLRHEKKIAGGEWMWNIRGTVRKFKVRGERLVSWKSHELALCPPQIPHGLAWGWTQASTVRGGRLIAGAMARPW
jgi:hypothetical protein